MQLKHFLSQLRNRRAVILATDFFLAAILSGSQIFGGYAPFGLGFIAAAGAGLPGLCALAGLAVGSLLFLSFTSAIKYIAAGILIFSVSMAFFDTPFFQRRFFAPLSTALCTAAVGFVYLSQASDFLDAAVYFLLEVTLAALAAACYRLALNGSETDELYLPALFTLALSLLLAAVNVSVGGVVSLGRCLAAALVVSAAWRGGAGMGCSAGFLAGLAMDTAGGNGLFYCMAYCLSALTASAGHGKKRILSALLFLCGTLIALLWYRQNAAYQPMAEAAAGCLVFLLIPSALWLPERKLTNIRPPLSADEAPAVPPNFQKRLRDAASVFYDLYDSLGQIGKPVNNDENIASVFDHAAQAVCRACPLRGSCWEKDYVTTYNALNDATAALRERGHATAEDFPAHFSARCIHITDFIGAVNAEFSALLLRRQYNRRLDRTRNHARDQYARLSELLSATAEQAVAIPSSVPLPAPLPTDIASAVRPKRGQRISGDTSASFTLEDGRLCLLLSDGMGSGEDARRESALTVRLLRQFLCAGVEPTVALRTLNSAWELNFSESGSFTTIDLLLFSPTASSAVFYKYGAAPSYLCHNGAVRRITGAALPAGLSEQAPFPEATHIHLYPGDSVVLVSDGFVDSTDDAWLRTLLTRWHGDGARSLVCSLTDASISRVGEYDDATILVLYLPPSAPGAV